jgi:hypothetical protein
MGFCGGDWFAPDPDSPYWMRRHLPNNCSAEDCGSLLGNAHVTSNRWPEPLTIARRSDRSTRIQIAPNQQPIN